jgi:hypothetical protein
MSCIFGWTHVTSCIRTGNRQTKQEIKDRCTAQWKDDQDRYGMIAYCIKQQVQAWAVIENFK